MTVYKSKKNESVVEESFRKGHDVGGSRLGCRCGRHCGGSCSNETSNHPETDFQFTNHDAFVSQDGSEYSFMNQESAELIWVRESCNITVNTTDTQAGVSLQTGLQLAIALVLNISIADSSQRDAIAQELTQQLDMTQRNKQKIYIYNTKDAVVTTQDTDIAINIQLLLQVLLSLVVLVDIL